MTTDAKDETDATAPDDAPPMSEWAKQEKRHRAWAANLKVGDEVALQDAGWNVRVHFARVQKITRAHGRTVIVDDKLFDERGHQRGRGIRHALSLVEPTQEVKDEERLRRLRLKVQRYFDDSKNINRLTLEQLRQIWTILQAGDVASTEQ